MKQKDFERLAASVKQAGAIRRGRLKPTRTTEFRREDARAVRTHHLESERNRPDLDPHPDGSQDLSSSTHPEGPNGFPSGRSRQ